MIALCATLAGCQGDAPPPVPPRSVETMVIAPASGGTGAVYSGQIVSQYEGHYGFRIGGMIVAKLVDVGQTVAAGQVLARLDPADVSFNVQSADAQVAGASAQAIQQTTDLRRARQLAAEGFISPAEYDRQKAAALQAGAQLRATQAQRTGAARQLSNTVLRAERAGVVTDFQGDVGQVVQAGQAVVTVATPGAAEAAISIPEGEVTGFRTARLGVRIWAAPAVSYAGHIRTLSAAANPQTRTFDARIAFEAPAGKAAIGSTAQVEAVRAVGPQSFRVPITALTRREGKPVVAIISGNPARVTLRAVQVGAVQDNAVLLSSGVRAGERVVTAGAHLLHPGEQVRAIASTAVQDQ